jgi:hypothetical protein
MVYILNKNKIIGIMTMKKKKLVKIIKKFTDRKINVKNTLYYCDFNMGISKQFWGFLNQCLSLPMEVMFDEIEERIILDLDTSHFRERDTKMVNHGDILTIVISKKGFKMMITCRDILAYKDPNVYDVFYPKIKEFCEKQYSQSFDNIVKDILYLSTICREQTIDKILA